MKIGKTNLKSVLKPLSFVVFAALIASASAGTKAYVSKTGSNTAPYDTWEKAANDLAVALAGKPAEVVIGDGEFVHSVSNHLITWDVHIHSANGPQATILTSKGAGCGHFRIESSASDALISGLTLKNGYGIALVKSGDTFKYRSVVYMGGGTISNCVYLGTSRPHHYASVFYLEGGATLLDSELVGDASELVAAANDGENCFVHLAGGALVDRCRIHGYRRTNIIGTNDDCPHSAIYMSNGAAVLRNSLVYDNCIGDSTHKNAADGRQRNGGAVFLRRGTVENCTITGNSAGGCGGGIYVSKQDGVIRNSIVYGNASHTAGNDIYAQTLPAAGLTYTCASDIGNATTLPLASAGDGCINANPKFKTKGVVPYYLRGGSPCIGAGNAAVVADGMLDLLGNPRMKEGAVDMGCYEVHDIPGLMLVVR